MRQIFRFGFTIAGAPGPLSLAYLRAKFILFEPTYIWGIDQE